MDARIGELMREGKTVFYAIIDGEMVEGTLAHVEKALAPAPSVKLTKQQRQALTNARDFGNANYYRAPQVGGCCMVVRSSRVRMLETLIRAKLLNMYSEITDAGRAALN